MTKTTRARYTLEFKQEAVRLVAFEVIRASTRGPPWRIVRHLSISPIRGDHACADTARRSRREKPQRAAERRRPKGCCLHDMKHIGSLSIQ